MIAVVEKRVLHRIVRSVERLAKAHESSGRLVERFVVEDGGHVAYDDLAEVAHDEAAEQISDVTERTQHVDRGRYVHGNTSFRSSSASSSRGPSRATMPVSFRTNDTRSLPRSASTPTSRSSPR